MTRQESPVALVIGASGVTGTPHAEQMLAAGWKVYGICRRPPVLRCGSHPSFHHLAVDLADGTDATLGTATMSFAVLPRRDSNPVMPPLDEPTRHAFVPLDDAPLEPLAAAIGIAADATGATAPMTPFVVNTLGAMQGGAVAALIARAATEATTAAAGRPAVCLDLAVNYLSLGKHGPIRAVPRVLRAGPDWCLVAVEVRDAGNEDRLMTVARAVAVAPIDSDATA